MNFMCKRTCPAHNTEREQTVPVHEIASGVRYKTLIAANEPIHVALAAALKAAGIGKSSLANRHARPKRSAAGISVGVSVAGPDGCLGF